MFCLALHTGSVSASRLVVEGARAELSVRCQVLSLQEVIEGLDADADGFVETGELEQHADEVSSYVASHYRVRAAAGLSVSPTAVRRVRTSGPDRLTGYELVDVQFAIRAERPIEELSLEVDLFRATSPDHVDTAEIRWNGRKPLGRLFTPRDEHWEVRAPGAITGEMHIDGLKRGWSAWAGPCALAALMLAAAGRKQALRVGAVFLAAEVATIALAVHWGIAASLTRTIILAAPLSVAYVAADYLMRHPDRARVLEVLVFGVVSGLALALALSAALADERDAQLGLAAFLGGLALSRLACVAVAAAVLGRATRLTLAGAALLVVGLVGFLRLAWFR
ncbi:MAG: hypothetical protein GY711_00455 [bacterium]|nr:hypothetical protein [bacterium]